MTPTPTRRWLERCARCSPSSATPPSPTPGAGRSASPGTGPARWAWTGRTGLAWAGGYVGDGVATTNLAGRTLADLIIGRHTDLTRLLWVGHRSRRWEPEPLRWLGIRAGLRLPSAADRTETRTGRPDRFRDWATGRLLGR